MDFKERVKAELKKLIRAKAEDYQYDNPTVEVDGHKVRTTFVMAREEAESAILDSFSDISPEFYLICYDLISELQNDTI